MFPYTQTNNLPHLGNFVPTCQLDAPTRAPAGNLRRKLASNLTNQGTGYFLRCLGKSGTLFGFSLK